MRKVSTAALLLLALAGAVQVGLAPAGDVSVVENPVPDDSFGVVKVRLATGEKCVWEIEPEPTKSVEYRTDDGIEVVFSGPKGTEYKVRVDTIDFVKQSIVRKKIVVKMGSGQPKPPGPNPPVDPVNPTAAKVTVVIAEETLKRTPAHGKVIYDKAFRDWASSGGHSVEVVDVSDPAVVAAGYVPFVDAVKGPPAVLVFDSSATGKSVPLKTFALPASGAELRALVEGTVRK